MHHAVKIVVRSRDRVLEIRYAEQQDRAQAQRRERFGFFHRFARGKTHDARHARDFARALALVRDEEWLHEAFRAHAGFADHAAPGGRAAYAARAFAKREQLRYVHSETFFARMNSTTFCTKIGIEGSEAMTSGENPCFVAADADASPIAATIGSAS